MKLQDMTWVQVEKYLQTKRDILVPVGSTEQHGPTGLLGIDWLSSLRIADEAGRRTGTLVAPPLCFGMAQHHLAFPGTISLTPSTYIIVVAEIINSLVRNGFRRLLFVNGHGGNIAPLTTAFCQALKDEGNHDLQLINWWHLPQVREYEDRHFGDKNGFHATCGEIALTMHTEPEAYAAIPQPKSFEATAVKSAWPLSPDRFRETFPDGRMGSDPSLSNAEHGREIFELAVRAVSAKLS